MRCGVCTGRAKTPMLNFAWLTRHPLFCFAGDSEAVRDEAVGADSRLQRMMASLAEKADGWRGEHSVAPRPGQNSVVDLSDDESSADEKLRQVMRAQRKMAAQEAKAKKALAAVQSQLRQSKRRKKRLGEVG